MPCRNKGTGRYREQAMHRGMDRYRRSRQGGHSQEAEGRWDRHGRKDQDHTFRTF